MELRDAMMGRGSIRAFLDKPVNRETITKVLDMARWAPSAGNLQPWYVLVLQGDKKLQVSQALQEAHVTGPQQPDSEYYPRQWVEPYKTRRRRCGVALYNAMSIAREDKPAREAMWNQNYDFFGAPVGLLFCLDFHVGPGAHTDLGMFIQNVMLAAQALGLATCPQASLAEYPDSIRGALALPADKKIICGMALGYADAEHKINQYRTERVEVDEFTTWFC